MADILQEREFPIMYKAVLFDLDGTLLNTLSDLAASVNHVMRKYGYPEHSEDAIRSFVGNGVRNLMRRAMPRGEDDPVFEEALLEQINYYRKNDRVKTKPYDGVLELLSALREKGILVGILSNKEQVAAKELCGEFFPESYDIALGNVKGRPIKPDPAIVEEALLKFKLNKSEVLYVGDSETDAATAQNSGIDCVLVSWGFRDREMLEKFSVRAIIDKPMELVAYV